MKFFIKNFSAFTLVELIVVVTIIALLSTIGFVSYSGYLVGVRDTNRISQATRILDSLQIYSISNRLPIPENKIDITIWSTIIWYQWDIWDTILESIDYSSSVRDPKDGTRFVYYLTHDRKNFQIMTFMEDQKSVFSFFSSTYANFLDRFPKTYGKRLWILLENNTHNPIHRLPSTTWDLVTLQGFTAYMSDTNVIEGLSSWDLLASSPIANCKRRKEVFWWNRDGIYEINPNGTALQVYCNMNKKWGGWLLVAKSDIAADPEIFSQDTEVWNIINLSGVYNLNVSEIDFHEIMLASFDHEINRINNYKIIPSSSFIYTLGHYTLNQSGITWWTSWDWFSWKQWMIFIR